MNLKHILFFLLLLSIGSQATSQYVLQSSELRGKFGVSLGSSLPQAELAEQTGEYAGGANTGLLFGFEYVVPFRNNKTFYWLSGLRVLINATDLPEGFPGIGLTGTESNWFHIIPTVGIRVTPLSFNNFELFCSIQAGGAYIITPEIESNTLLRGSIFTTANQNSSSGITYALSPSVGVKFLRNFELNAEYIYGGLVEYETTTLGLGDVRRTVEHTYTVPMEFLNIFFNYHFYF
ncbi:MAG: hypothetical protein GF372_00815 [Candidatus Marinimicrobia bacterium]|nr:hypothetical protein [Candidatus Neomarinimicrobiota bacterium]